MKTCGCGADCWDGLSGCYYCFKLKAGLIGWDNGYKLSNREKSHVGVLPGYEPDPRAVCLAALYELETSSFDRYDGADRAMMAALAAIGPDGIERDGLEGLR
jgi:hypothetical protein